jgi:hypothetical protein
MHGIHLLKGSPWANLYAVGAVKKKGKTTRPGLFEKREMAAGTRGALYQLTREIKLRR